ncbi:MAG: YggS family pyridoxal phosphate-dependent enzyme [Clostridia bacterium]|nr:YggS family pyridoxal phosphate-dependent enzyme [Clostridia bacterium]
MIKDNYNEIIARISEYAEPSTVTVVAVTKYQSLESANQAILCGIKDIGENRVQQLCERNELFLPVKKHLIGHLQTNKVKPAVAIADLIQSVDSVRVAVEIAKQASKLDKIQDVLIEINIADEATKTGASINDLNDILNACANISGISVKGLMAVMPIGAQEYYFEKMYSLFQDAKTRNFTNTQLQTLSMGMSDDYPLAVKHGSNMIRVGRTLFK